jgi:hypothetical protein
METPMRDMMATHERLEAREAQIQAQIQAQTRTQSPVEARESLRKAAAAAFEALPAILLAGALLMPALAALAAKTANQQLAIAPGAEVSQVIAAQGNQALADIRAEQRESLRRSLALPKLSS